MRKVLSKNVQIIKFKIVFSYYSSKQVNINMLSCTLITLNLTNFL